MKCRLFRGWTGGGVCGNATGGRRSAALGGLTNGLVITFLPAFLLGALGNFGDADFGWFGILVGGGAGAGGRLGVVLVILVGLAGAAAVPAQGLTRTYPKVLPPKGAPVPPSH
ncbi:PTS ascorbate transporter subunit IIC [Corynebacterium diphtheriae]|nr:PTS ascorbate transporter subunit IIC [Corynebacterium diphtheriae]CAB0730989.1 PTS ascorbate transporter subunit IIC [Corynebacterium diphtheriae]